MSGSPIASFGIVRAIAGAEEELGQRLTALVAPTNAEAGCLRYSLFRAREDPAVWLLFEEWRSDADLAAHVASPHFREFLGTAKALIAEVTSYPSDPVA